MKIRKKMKFLKQIFGLTGRLDRRGYFLLGVLPMLGFTFWVYIVPPQLNSIVSLILFVPIFILALISAVKRGRDSGLNGLVTLLLFGAIPILIIFLNLQLKIDISYMTFAFIAYLLLMHSSSKELKIVGKVESIITIIMIVVYTWLIILVTPSIVSSHTCGGEGLRSISCTQMSGIAYILDTFNMDNESYPTTEEGLIALISNPNALKYPNYASDGYLEKLPKDAWSNYIIYIKTKDGFELVSYGADRKEGGEDEGADIYYSKCRGKR